MKSLFSCTFTSGYQYMSVYEYSEEDSKIIEKYVKELSLQNIIGIDTSIPYMIDIMFLCRIHNTTRMWTDVHYIVTMCTAAYLCGPLKE